ncbi:GntR family transcriptional regulator [Rhodococcus koreensis]
MDLHSVGEDESPGDVIARVLRDDILAGRLTGGERLIEEAIAKKFGVSRVPVREALGQLEGEGFVTIVRYRGATVSTTLRKDNRELLEVRRGLEVLAAQLAAANRGGSVAAELAAVAERIRPHAAGQDRDVPTGSAGDGGRPFHDLIAIAAGNDQLREMLAGVNRRVAWGLGDDPEASVSDHAALAAAIVSGASVQAGYLMDEHLRRDEQHFGVDPTP